jgi:hypothetical protein
VTDAPAPAPDPRAGATIVQADLVGTSLFALTAGIEAIFLQRWSEVIGIAVAVGLFVVGCVIFFVAYLTAIQRSRTDEISIVNLFLLGGGTAPRAVARRLNGLLAAQVVIALVTSAVRPFTELAFGILVPVFGLAMNGWWGARHGRFPPRVIRTRTRRRPRGAPPDTAGGPHPDGEMEQNASHG